jgi:DNA-binding protein HU-beta
VVERAAREGVNPSTQEKMTIESKKVVKFKAGAELSDKINR